MKWRKVIYINNNRIITFEDTINPQSKIGEEIKIIK